MNTKTTTTPGAIAAGEHKIFYAYPSSTSATILGRGKTGCYVLEIGRCLRAVESYEEALSRAKAQGTKPNRWSMDHQENARFLEMAQA